MPSPQQTTSSDFTYGTVNLMISAVSAATTATLDRLNREDSWFRNNNSAPSNHFLTMAVWLFGINTVINLGGVAINYGKGFFKVAKSCQRNTPALDHDLEVPLSPR